MGLFNNLFKAAKDSTSLELGAPVKGTIIPLESVADETFAQGILGNGTAIVPEDGRFCAPADGEISSMFPTGHAYSMITSEDVEILVHIGFDTVKLKGAHFTVHAAEGQKVKRGDLLVEADIEAIKADGYDVTTPMVILNTSDFSEFTKETGKVNAGDRVLTLAKA